jgi:hypothetical protein
LHALDVHDAPERHELDEFPGQVNAAALAMCPFVA